MIKSFYTIFFLSLLCFFLVVCEHEETIKPFIPSDEIKVLINGILIDGTGNEPVINKVIIIQSGLIYAIENDFSYIIPPEARIIDLKQAYVLPGFFNTHVHSGYNESNLKAWANAGVTSVRDLGYKGNLLFQDVYKMRDELNCNNDNARLVAAGPLLTTVGGYGTYSVTSVSDAEYETNRLIEYGTDIIKIAIEDNLQGQTWPMLSAQEIEIITETAHNNNIPVSAHISHSDQVEIAINGHVNDLAHMAIDVVPDNLLEEVFENNIYWIPTLELWDGVSNMYSITWDEIAIDNLSRFISFGGKVAVGTDYDGYITPFELGMPIKEMKLMQLSGMTNMQIIVAATLNSAHVCGLEDKLGSIETGKIADLLIIGSNPLLDIEAFLNVKMVIKNGEFILN